MLDMFCLGVQDSYGEDEFERSDGEGGGRRSKSPVRHGGDDNNCGNMPCDVSDWPMSRRVKGLETLKRLSKANRRVKSVGSSLHHTIRTLSLSLSAVECSLVRRFPTLNK